MTAYVPGLLDRLMGERGPAGAPSKAGAGRHAIEQLKDSVARELEALLNARAAIAPERLASYPLARASVLNYGLGDFAAFCLSSSADRAALCASLKEAIERHEPRLQNVSATLEPAAGHVNRLEFVIQATLRAAAGAPGAAGTAGAEPVNFNAVLQPSSLHYAVKKAGRTPPP